MPRLPGPEALGQAPNMRPTGGAPRVPNIDMGDQLLARGFQNLAAAFDDIETGNQNQADEVDLARAQSTMTTRLLELNRSLENDPDYDTYGERYAQGAAAAQTEAAASIRNRRILDRWTPRADLEIARGLDHILGRANGMRREAQVTEFGTILGDLGQAYVTETDETRREIIRRNMEEQLALGGRILSPTQLQRLTQEHLLGLDELDARALAQREGPLAVWQELTGANGRATQPSSGQISEQGLGYIRRFLPPLGEATAPQARAQADAELREQAAQMSALITENVQAPLTQLQHDALVGIGVRRGPEALREMFPSVNEGNWQVAGGIGRTIAGGGSLTTMEQPAPTGAGGQQGQGPPQPARPGAETYEAWVQRIGATRLNDPAQRASMRREFAERDPNADTGPSASTLDYLNYYEQQGQGRGGQGRQGALSSDFGSVSARYESGGRGVGFISSGRGDPGGQSYGIHQLSTAASMGSFLASQEGAPYRDAFSGMRPGTPEFNQAYREIAARDPQAFADAQRDFYVRTHYNPLRTNAEGRGFDVANRGVQEALFSISVQHGGAAQILARAAATLQPGASAEDQIRALYQARTQYVQALTSLPEDTRSSVLNRYRSEVRDALALATGQGTAVAGARFGNQVAQANTGTATDARPGPRSAPQPSTPGPDSVAEELGDMLTGQAPSSRFANMPVDRRRVLIGQLATQMRPDMQNDINRSIELMNSNQEPPRDPQGRTALDRATGVLTDAQLARSRIRWEEAAARRQALTGVTTMSDAELSARASSLPPGMNRSVATTIDRIIELRRTDPVRVDSGGNMRGVDRRTHYTTNAEGNEVPLGDRDSDMRLQVAPEIARAHEMLRARHPNILVTTDADGNVTLGIREQPDATSGLDAYGNPTFRRDQDPARQEAWRILIEARLAAQARRGVPPQDRVPISQAEATALLNMPADGRMTEDEFRRRLVTAVDRAQAEYGPYARDVLTAAFNFRGTTNERREMARGQVDMMVRMAMGDRLSADDISRFATMQRIEQERQAWMGRNDGALTGAAANNMFGGAFPGVGSLGGISNSGDAVPPVWGPDLGVGPAPTTGWGAGSNGRGNAAPAPNSQAQGGNPTPEQLAWLRANISQRWQAFEDRFGPGSAHRYLNEQQDGR